VGRRVGTTKGTQRDLVAEVAYLTRALKAPTLRESVARLADRARAEGWGAAAAILGAPTYEDLLILGRVGPGEQYEPAQHSGEHGVGESERHGERSC
jgi:hypothetical protein